MPGGFASLGEVVVLAEIDQVRIGPLQVGETVVAAHPLVAQAEGLAVAQAVGERPAEGTVVDAPAASAAGIPAERQAQVALQAVRSDADAPLETEEMLGVDLLQFAIVVAAGPVRGDTVVQAGQVETVRLRRAGG